MRYDTTALWTHCLCICTHHVKYTLETDHIVKHLVQQSHQGKLICSCGLAEFQILLKLKKLTLFLFPLQTLLWWPFCLHHSNICNLISARRIKRCTIKILWRWSQWQFRFKIIYLDMGPILFLVELRKQHFSYAALFYPIPMYAIYTHVYIFN